MRYQVEEVAAGANLRLSGSASWSYCEDWPHISTFRYELSRFDMDSSVERWLPVGVADGYRIAHDWTVESSLALLDEADALDEDITTYIQSLMNELSAYDRTYGNVAGVTAGQRVILLRHVEPAAGEDVTRLWSQVTASLAMMDAPVFILVDPQEMPVERETAAAKLTGRGRTAALLELGFSRMVTAPYVWAWNRDMADTFFPEASYEAVLRGVGRQNRLPGS